MLYMIDFSIPLGGMEQATSSVDRTAAQIAKSGFTPQGDTVDLSSEMVSLMQARNDFATNVKVLQTEDDLTKSLLNIVA